jgi:uncharacterized protein (TIGR02266 family)
MRCWCEGENVTFYARVGDLSEGGLSIWTSTPLDPGSRARLRLGNGHTIEAPAVVVWARTDGGEGPPGMGLRFEQVDDRLLQVVRELMQGDRASSTPA